MTPHPPSWHPEARALAAAGVHLCEVARRVGRAHTSVREWAQRAGVTFTPHSQTAVEAVWRIAPAPIDAERLLALHVAGHHPLRIADELGVTFAAVCYWFARRGIRPHPTTREEYDRRLRKGRRLA